jgi:excisionase family DNA binding protein
MSKTGSPLLHTKEAAAARLSLSKSTIGRLLKAKKLRVTRIMGRTLISEAELQRLIDESTDRGDPDSDKPSDPDPDQPDKAKLLPVLHSHKYL